MKTKVLALLLTLVSITVFGQQRPPLMVLAFANPETIVLGESSTLTANASGGTGNYDYTWEPKEGLSTPNEQTTIATPTEAGTMIYLITVYDGQTSVSAEVTVTVNNATPTLCPAPDNFAGVSYYDDGELGATLSWDRANYEFTLDRFEIYRSQDELNYELVQRIVNTPSITHYQCNDLVKYPGEYYYRIFAYYQDGCISDYIEIAVTVLDYTAVKEHVTNQVAIYPNPSSGKVVVASEAMQQINIVNSFGQTLRQIQTESNNVTIDLSVYGKGMYMLMIQTDNGITAKKVIIE